MATIRIITVRNYSSLPHIVTVAVKNLFTLVHSLFCIDGFNFPGEVDKNQENGTCAFSVKSSCTVDDYLPSSSCSNCSLNDNIFICDDVQLGKNCTFTVQAALCNFISVESDLAFCSRIGGEY